MVLIRAVAMLTVAVSALVLPACSSPPGSNPVITPASSTTTIEGALPTATEAPEPVTSGTSATNTGAPTPATSDSIASTKLPPHLDPKNRLAKERSIYFDFDDATITSSDAMWLVELHGDYLLSQPQLAIKIEGNTDEWGGAEYNLALGQKRAEAVARVLTLYGVKSTQMEVISWGKERPKATGHDEPAWAENRRADLVYPTQ